MSRSRIAAAALVVAVAYYVGANVGFILRFPPTTPSVVWPPNAILTTTLLLAPPRRWWIYLLAALPAHIVAELQASFPPALLLVLFLTNCSEALLAAAGVRWLSDAPARFDTLRRVAVFIGAAVVTAPFLSSFPDAAAVSAFTGEQYQTVWKTRFFSNVLTELTLVPAAVMAITRFGAWLRPASRVRRLEAVALSVALALVGMVVFLGPTDAASIPGNPGTPVLILLPIILWGTVRFGPGGASAVLLAAALFAIWAATHGYGPFVGLPLEESVFALQVFLTIVAIPIMCLAALIDERRHAEAVVAERLRFERLLSRLSGAFVHLPSQAMDGAFDTWLRRLGEFFEVDQVTLARVTRNGRARVTSQIWSRDGASATDGGGSMLAIPLEAGGRVLGDLSFVASAAERAWPEDVVQRLHLVSEVFASAVARREADDALRTSEIMNSAILASLQNGVAVLDRDGCVIAVNDTWRRFATENASWHFRVETDASYVEACGQAAARGEDHAREALRGIQGVLARQRASAGLEYRADGLVADRWFAMSVVPLNRAEGGAVVAHTDVTERKRAELDAERSRQELAHFTRVSTMGELTASLAHELNQPLTGILTNARAAQRFLRVAPPDLDEVQGALSDIVDDDRRAGEVIQRLRDLLRKAEPQRALLDLNALIRDVARILNSDALIRNVALTLDLDPELPLVTADRVQLQQVVLNLVVNAMDAMADNGHDRLLVVRTEHPDSRWVCVRVQDAGPGLAPGAEAMIFEPFYSTKPAGMGMGLAIARSIIEKHGGVIELRPNPTRGVTALFTLPLDAQSA